MKIFMAAHRTEYETKACNTCPALPRIQWGTSASRNVLAATTKLCRKREIYEHYIIARTLVLIRGPGSSLAGLRKVCSDPWRQEITAIRMLLESMSRLGSLIISPPLVTVFRIEGEARAAH